MDRKAMLRAYRDRKVTGGVYGYRNATNGKILLQSTCDITKAANLLAFSKEMGLCPHPLLRDDWGASGGSAFSVEILETLDKKEEQTGEEFAADVRTLESLWRERLGATGLY